MSFWSMICRRGTVFNGARTLLLSKPRIDYWRPDLSGATSDGATRRGYSGADGVPPRPSPYFLVACTQLCRPFCRSVGPSVRRSVGRKPFARSMQLMAIGPVYKGADRVTQNIKVKERPTSTTKPLFQKP